MNGTAPYAKEILNPAWSCTNGNGTYTNRVLNVGAADTAVCYTWGTCNTCVVQPPPANVIVTFEVQNPDSTPVYVFGSWTGFGNWPGDLMTDPNNDGIYTATLSLAANSGYEFLYVNGVGPTKEVLDPAWTCTNGNGQYTNRVLTVGSSNMNICNIWALCDTCGAVVIPNVAVDFVVESPDSTPVYLFGNWNGFNNWPGTPMTMNANGTWHKSLNLPENSTVEYLYVNGAAPYAKEILDPSWPCTNGNSQYTNRILNIGSTNLTTCSKWALCTNCSMSGINTLNPNTVSIALNTHSITINSIDNKTFDGLEIFDVAGRKITSIQTTINSNKQIGVSLQNNKMYLVRLRAGNTYFSVKQIASSY